MSNRGSAPVARGALRNEGKTCYRSANLAALTERLPHLGRDVRREESSTDTCYNLSSQDAKVGNLIYAIIKLTRTDRVVAGQDLRIITGNQGGNATKSSNDNIWK